VSFWKEVIVRKRTAWERERESALDVDVEGRACVGCGFVAGVPQEREAEAERTAGGEDEVGTGEGTGEGEVHEAGDSPGKSRIRFPKWATGLRSKPDTESKDVDGENEAAVAGPNSNIDATATEPLLATPDESSTEVGGPSTSPPSYGTLDQSVESVPSVPETVVRKKDKGKKKLVDVE
jgi:hypothetical protein